MAGNLTKPHSLVSIPQESHIKYFRDAEYFITFQYPVEVEYLIHRGLS